MYFLNRVEGFVFYIFRAGWHIDLGWQKEQMMLILQAGTECWAPVAETSQ